MNREEWLNNCKELLVEYIFKPEKITVHKAIRISPGWPFAERNGKVKGQCFDTTASKDGHNEIFISPRIEEADKACHVLAHEIIHAVLGTEAGHKGPFVVMMKRIGLEGKPTATIPGEAFKRTMSPLVKRLGPYPHATLDTGIGRKKQGTRLLKADCHGCGYTIRVTRKWAETGLPVCSTCRVEFTLEGEEGDE